jgi:hypothetical protein
VAVEETKLRDSDHGRQKSQICNPNYSGGRD